MSASMGGHRISMAQSKLKHLESPDKSNHLTSITPDASPSSSIDLDKTLATPRLCVVTRKSLGESIGLQLQSSRSMPVPRVSWVKPDGTAHRAGVMIGDVLVQVDSHDCLGLSNNEIAAIIQGLKKLEISFLVATSSTGGKAHETIQKISQQASVATRPPPSEPVVSDLNNMFACASPNTEASAKAKDAESADVSKSKEQKVDSQKLKPGQRGSTKSSPTSPKKQGTKANSKAKEVIGAIVAAGSKKKTWQAPKHTTGTFSNPSALSRGSKYQDKPPPMKAFWEKGEADKSVNGKKHVSTHSKPISKKSTSSAGLKSFINEKRKANRGSGTFDVPIYVARGGASKTESRKASQPEEARAKAAVAPSPVVSTPASPEPSGTASPDSILIRIQKERDDARRERDNACNQLAEAVGSYERLIREKDGEIERLHLAAAKQRQELVQRTAAVDQTLSASAATRSEVLQLAKLREELVLALERSTNDNSVLVAQNTEFKMKAHSASVRLKDAVAERDANNVELGELRAMIRTMEEALRAKDDVTKIKIRSYEQRVAELERQIRENETERHETMVSSMRKDLLTLQEELQRTRASHEEDLRMALLKKQEEMNRTLSALEGAGQVGVGSENAVIDELRNALVAKEVEKREALEAMAREKAEFARTKDLEAKHMMESKDEELSRALDLAQEEVDRLLEEKQAEVDELLDEKDNTIAALVADLKEANVRARLGGSEFSGNSNSDSSIVAELRELVDMKNALLLSREHDTETMRQRHEEQLQELEENMQKQLDEVIVEKDQELQTLTEQMEAALTEAMSAKGDLLCLDEKANELIAEQLGQPGDSSSTDKPMTALARVESALANTDSTVNKEVVRLKLQIARLVNSNANGSESETELVEAAKQSDTITSLQQENLALFGEIELLKARAKGSVQSMDAAGSSQNDESETIKIQQVSKPANDPVLSTDSLATGSEPASESLARKEIETEILRMQEATALDKARIGELETKVADLERELAMSHRQFMDLESRSEDSVARCATLQSQLNESELKLERKNEEMIAFDSIRKKLLNQIMDLKGNARVFCRVRPILEGEGEADRRFVHMASGGYTGNITIVDPTSQDVRGNKLTKKHDFEFNHVFGPDSTQDEIYREVEQLVQCAVSGFNVVIFAYGQTGSGKTYTMTGEPRAEQEGIIPRCVRYMFEELATLSKRDWQYTLSASFLEIYNETIRDLLVDDEDVNEDIRYEIKQDRNGKTYVSNLTVMEVTSASEVTGLIESAGRNRAVGVSDLNDRSSRSHSICQLTLEGNNAITGSSVSSKIYLVDLAGSERLSNPSLVIDAAPMDDRARLTAEYAQRQKETLSINKSLSSLANVVQAIQTKSQHVPYRNSKLTYCLKDALGGDSKSLMLVNICQREDCLGETLCSLRFAAKVNNTSFGKPARASPTDR